MKSSQETENSAALEWRKTNALKNDLINYHTTRVQTMKLTAAVLKEIRADPIHKLRTASVQDLQAIVQKANHAYYNTGTPLFEDDVYDIVKDLLASRDPQNPILTHVGAACDACERKVELPHYMGSMNKMKAAEVPAFIQAQGPPHSYVVSDKLDGVSALAVFDAGGAAAAGPSLYTRGNGRVGQNITHLVPFVQHVPRNIPGRRRISVRGELVISKRDFIDHAMVKQGATARNLVSGQVNATVPNLDVCRHIQFVVYQVCEPRGLSCSKQIELAKQLGFKVVPSTILGRADIDGDALGRFLHSRRQQTEFEIDGLVVCHDGVHEPPSGQNPPYAFAYKNMLFNDAAEVVVTGVEWKLSKDGLLKPTVLFDPVTLNGVSVQRATGFNARFIEAHGIGPGARLMVTRSGDVIPHIKEVLRAAGAPALPDRSEWDWEWNETRVDARVRGERGNNNALQLKRLQRFFQVVKAEGVSDATIERLFNSGFRTVRQVFGIHDAAALMQHVPGFQSKSAEATVAALRAARAAATCTDIMVASNTLGRGFGERRLRTILCAFPDALRRDPPIEALLGVEGVQQKTAQQFLDGLRAFRAFAHTEGLEDLCTAPPGHQQVPHSGCNGVSGDMAGVVAVFTGFRSEDLEQQVAGRGGKVVGTVSKKVTVVVTGSDGSKTSGKVARATELGIPVVHRDTFVELWALAGGRG